MKRKLFFGTIGIAILSSCGSIKTNEFSAKKYTKFDNTQKTSIEFKKKETSDLYAGNNVNYLTKKDVQLELNSIVGRHEINESLNPQFSKKEIKKLSKAISKGRSSKKLSSFLKEENAITNKTEKEDFLLTKKAPSEDSEFWLKVILALILPPLGVYLHLKAIGEKFWISLLLTLLFWVPGAIYAILVVTDSI